MLPKVEEWAITSNGDAYTAPELIKSYLYGKIYNDNRFPDGDTILTSTIQNIDLENGVVQTRNTSYKLGKISPDFYEYCKKINFSNLTLLEKFQ